MNTLQLGLIQGNLRCFGANGNMSRDKRFLRYFFLLKYSSVLYFTLFPSLVRGHQEGFPWMCSYWNWDLGWHILIKAFIGLITLKFRTALQISVLSFWNPKTMLAQQSFRLQFFQSSWSNHFHNTLCCLERAFILESNYWKYLIPVLTLEYLAWKLANIWMSDNHHQNCHIN